MTDARTLLRSLLIYGICIPLALALGYLIANPLDLQGLTLIGAFFLILCMPLVIHYHYPFMLLAWNMGAVVFFLPGRMNLWMVAVAISFGVSFTHRIMDKRMRFLHVPSLNRPLLFFAAVVVATMTMRGDLGFHFSGGDTVGGRKYIEILLGILAYFALTARKIPRDKVQRYLAFFFLSGALVAISILYGRIPHFFDFIFLFIPPSGYSFENEIIPPGMLNISFFRPFATAGGAVFAYILVRYGIREMFSPGRRFLLILFMGVVVVTLMSGSRLALVLMAMTFTFQFCLEGLLRTRLAIVLAVLCLLAAVATAPFVTRLPVSIQRTLAIFPIKVDPYAAATAAESTEWRKQIWRITIPEIPKYLLLGKGYAISSQDLEFITDRSFSQYRAEDRAATIAGDYHNGPLSVIIPLGIWGVIAFLWLILAGVRVLFRNYRYGDPGLKNLNTYLYASYLVSIVVFCFVFGALASGLYSFTGILGLSVAINGGVARRPQPEPFRPVTRQRLERAKPQSDVPAVGPA